MIHPATALVPLLLLVVSTSVPAASVSSSVRILVLRSGEPVADVPVQLSRGSTVAASGETSQAGTILFRDLDPGAYVISAGTTAQSVVLSSGLETRIVDLDASFLDTGRFGRSVLRRAELLRLPHAGTVSTVFETLEPMAVTDRIDVAGIEGGTQPLWSVRGSSWTQNRILLDGLEITDPAGGAPLLYPDVLSFASIELVSADPRPPARGPGAELHLVTRPAPSALEGGARFRYTGRALQSENLDERLVGLGVEPREMVRFPSARWELGGAGLHGAVNGFSLSTRRPRFEGEEETRLLGATAKLAARSVSLLAIAQRWRKPTFGAGAGVSRSATTDASETFQVLQARTVAAGLHLAASFARARTRADHVGSSSPLRDLATGELDEAPLRVGDGGRSRLSGRTSGEWLVAEHLLGGAVELDRAVASTTERVPGGMERLLTDGAAHAVRTYAGSGERRVVLHRLALSLRDTFFVRFLGRPWEIVPAFRLDRSGAEEIRWTSVAASLSARFPLTRSSEIHFSLGRHPHAVTSHWPAATRGGLSWIERRWIDRDGDRRVSPGEIGELLRRGGPAYTSLDDPLPRPTARELTVGIEKRFGRGFLRFSGYHRRETRLLQTVNVGAPPESYETFVFHDVGMDGALNTSDDNELLIFDRSQAPVEDRFLLTHPPGLDAFSQGVDLLVGVDHGRLSWRLSGRAYRDVGSGSVGNRPEQNDTGVVGDLFDDPNTLTMARGRLFFDRAFTGKLTLLAEAPRGVRFGAAVRYWDGQPFARHLFFPDLGQGFVVVQALPRGRQRYAFNMTVDVRVERELSLGGLRWGFAAEVFNLFNQTLQTEENVRSGPRFREPTAVQPARTLTLEAGLRF